MNPSLKWRSSVYVYTLKFDSKRVDEGEFFNLEGLTKLALQALALRQSKEIVGSLFFSERLSPGYSGFPLSSKTCI